MIDLTFIGYSAGYLAGYLLGFWYLYLIVMGLYRARLATAVELSPTDIDNLFIATDKL